MQSVLRGIIRSTLLFAWLTLWGPVLVVCRMIGGETFIKARRSLYKVGLSIVRIKLAIKGNLPADRPVLFVSNHVSYLDIIVLGSLLPASFISKQEVKSWPLFGLVAVITNTVFIERRASRTTQGLDRVKGQLESGQSLILFPEGTTSNGNHVERFKTSYFQVVEQKMQKIALTIQPVSIAYTHINGLPMGLKWRTHFAWTGNASLLPHVWEVLKHGGARVEVTLHPVLRNVNPDRKAVAAHCQRLIASSLSESLKGEKPLAGNVIEFVQAKGAQKSRDKKRHSA